MMRPCSASPDNDTATAKEQEQVAETSRTTVVTTKDGLMAKKQKVHSLTGRIDERLMRQAFKAVKRNRGAAGIDKVSIAMFEEKVRRRSCNR